MDSSQNYVKKEEKWKKKENGIKSAKLRKI